MSGMGRTAVQFMIRRRPSTDSAVSCIYRSGDSVVREHERRFFPQPLHGLKPRIAFVVLMPSFARLSPLAKGRIVGLREAGLERRDIVKLVKKKDGKKPSLYTVDAVLDRYRKNPDWDGLEHRTAGGRPPDLAPKQADKIRQILLRDVGKHVVSATYVKRK